MLVAARAKDMQARVGLVLNGESYVANVRDGGLTIRREPLRDVAVTITGEPGALGAVVYGGVPLAESELRIDGDVRLAKRFIGLFSLPPKVNPKSR